MHFTHSSMVLSPHPTIIIPNTVLKLLTQNWSVWWVRRYFLIEHTGIIVWRDTYINLYRNSKHKSLWYFRQQYIIIIIIYHSVIVIRTYLVPVNNFLLRPRYCLQIYFKYTIYLLYYNIIIYWFNYNNKGVNPNYSK